MENQKLLKQIKKLVEDAQLNLLTNVCNYLGIADTKKNELKSLFIDNSNSNNSNNTTISTRKRNTQREPSEYNKFVKSKIAELRAESNITGSQALQVAAKAWKEKDKQGNTPIQSLVDKSYANSESSNIIDINDDDIDLTPIPKTPIITDSSLLEKENQLVIQNKPKSLTRIRFFGSTYLWDKSNDSVYNDDISSTNNNFTCVGKMETNNNNPTKIIFN